MAGVQCVAAQIPCGHPVDRHARLSGDGFQACEVLVDGAGFPAGVGEDRRVHPREVASQAQQQQAGALHLSAQRQHPQHRRAHAGTSQRHRATSGWLSRRGRDGQLQLPGATLPVGRQPAARRLLQDSVARV
jgi:hypothetical protein